MPTSKVARERLSTQRIFPASPGDPVDVVRRLGAVQAQDYLGALWAVGLRTQRATEASVEETLAAKRLVRTWPMRGTLHLVAAEDVRWMLDLLTPRVLARARGRFHALGLDSAVLARSRKLIVGALAGRPPWPRSRLYRHLEQAKIATGSQRGIHILWRMAQEGLICLGARAGWLQGPLRRLGRSA